MARASLSFFERVALRWSRREYASFEYILALWACMTIVMCVPTLAAFLKLLVGERPGVAEGIQALFAGWGAGLVWAALSYVLRNGTILASRSYIKRLR